MRAIANILWLLIAIISLFAIMRVSYDYLTTINSLQNVRWRVASFDSPTTDATQTSVVLEVQNLSAVNFIFKDLEVFLWLNDMTVGKTYGRFEQRSLPPGTLMRLPLAVQIDPAHLRDAKAKARGNDRWQISGSYKVSAPFAENDFVYHLRLDIGP